MMGITSLMPVKEALPLDESSRSFPREEWDDYLARTEGGTIFQTWAWGEARRLSGWHPHRITIRGEDSSILAAAQLGVRKYGPLKVVYCQRGPVWSNVESLRNLLEEMRVFARKEEAVFLKVNPDLKLDAPELAIFKAEGYQPCASQEYMHQATYRIDLSRSEEELLRGMEGRTRRAIARSKRDGVAVDTGQDSTILARFEALLDVTAGRRGFAAPEHALLEALRLRLSPLGRFHVHVSRALRLDAAAAVHLSFAGRCSYMWGGSTADKLLKRTNASERLQWEAMLAAKARGDEVLDLHGVTLDADGNPTGGIALFKRGFGGDLVRLAGDLELPLRKGPYIVWRRVEPLYLRQRSRVR